MGARLFPKVSRAISKVDSKFAFSLSILLIKSIRARLLWSAWCQTRSVWTSTPATASTTTRTLSTTARAPSTSPTKSAYPGVSKKLILWFAHSTSAMSALIEMLRLISSGSWSVTVVPFSTAPCLVVAPEIYNAASTREVFPHPPCPMTAIFLICSLKYFFKPIPPSNILIPYVQLLCK